MKKIILICLLWVLYLGVNAQTDSFPSRTPQGSPKTIVENQGGFRSHIINYSFTDTTQANLVSYFNSYNGAQIMTTQDSVQFWLRYNYKWNKVSGGGGSVTATDSAVVLKNVTQIASLSNARVNSIFVTDTLRGGNFFRYTGTDAADNGMIFTDALGSKWLRQTSNENNKINILWYGARQNGVDCRSKFLSALDYMYSHPRFRTLYLPYDSVTSYAANVYYLTDSIVINKSISILGDGTIDNPKSRIYFPAHTTGFVFKYAYLEDAIYPSVKNIRIQCATDGTWNTSKHAITSNTVINIDNVYIDNYDGNGLHISACGTVPSGDNNNYGKADHAIISSFTALNCTNGIFVEGCDANAIKFDNINVSENRRWGVYDNGFLGNIYIQPHAAFNGSSPAGAKTIVTYGGLYYAAIPGHDGYYGDAADSNYNKQPDLNVGTYWQEITAMSSTGAWSSTTRYYSGGAMAIVGANSWSEILGSYTEGFQPPIWLNARSFVDGGDNGAGVVNGVQRNVFAGQQQILNGNLYVANRIGVNIDPLASIHAKNISGVPYTAIFEGYNTLAAIKLKNTTTSVEFDLNGTDIQWYDLSGLRMTLGTSSLTPGTNNTFDFGSSSLKWKDIYANLSSGAGTKQVRWDGNKLTVADTLHSLTLLTNRGIKITASTTGDTVYIDDFVKVATTTSASTITPNCDTTNMYTVTALATDPTFAAPSGTPYDGQPLTIRVKDNGTSRTLTWNGIYRAGTDVALPTATTISKQIYSFFIYNAADSKWDLINVKNGF